MQAKLDLMWGKIVRDNSIHLPLPNDPRLWTSILSGLQCLMFIWFASKAEKSDPYEVFTILQFFVFLFDFVPLTFVMFKFPSLSKLYFTRNNNQSVLLPIYPSKFANLLPLVLHSLKLLYVFAFTLPIILSGDVILRHTVIILVAYLFYFIAVFAVILLAWQRFRYFSDWDADEHKLPTAFTSLIPFNISNVPTFTIPSMNVSGYFNTNSGQIDLDIESQGGGPSTNNIDNNDEDDISTLSLRGETTPMMSKSSKRDIIASDNDYEVSLDPIKHSPLLLNDDVHVHELDIPSQLFSSIGSSNNGELAYSPPVLTIASIAGATSPLLGGEDELP